MKHTEQNFFKRVAITLVLCFLLDLCFTSNLVYCASTSEIEAIIQSEPVLDSTSSKLLGASLFVGTIVLWSLCPLGGCLLVTYSFPKAMFLSPLVTKPFVLKIISSLASEKALMLELSKSDDAFYIYYALRSKITPFFIGVDMDDSSKFVWIDCFCQFVVDHNFFLGV